MTCLLDPLQQAGGYVIGVYQRREPQKSPYYQCVQDHFDVFERVYDERFERQYGFFRPYVSHVIYRYLD